MFKGTIIENSLQDKKILDEVSVLKSYRLDDWALHDVELEENKIPELSYSLAEGPWYIHVWKGDSIIVIFKNKTFRINAFDKMTWNEAIAYGKSIGIPEEQLDFKTA